MNINYMFTKNTLSVAERGKWLNMNSLQKKKCKFVSETEQKDQPGS